MPVIPLPLYQVCNIDIEQFWTYIQSSLFLAFGEPFILISPITRAEPPVRSSRRRGSRTRRRANSTRQTVAPWGKCPKYSRLSRQGRWGILLSHSYVSFLGCGFVRRGKGEILCTIARV